MSDYNDGILPEPCLRMDTHFGDEYESIEFGDGTGYIKAAPILAKFGALYERIDALRDEEARLREEISTIRADALLIDPLFQTMKAANESLIAENAKLLELLRPLVDFADYECNLMYDCTACQMISGDRPCYLVKALRYLHDLGVDV